MENNNPQGFLGCLFKVLEFPELEGSTHDDTQHWLYDKMINDYLSKFINSGFFPLDYFSFVANSKESKSLLRRGKITLEVIENYNYCFGPSNLPGMMKYWATTIGKAGRYKSLISKLQEDFKIFPRIYEFLRMLFWSA